MFKRLFVLVALMLAPLLSAAVPAFAQPATGFAQTATATTFTPSGGGADPYGMMGQGGYSEGTVSGSTINGTYSMQEVRSYSPDGTTGSLTGQFTMQDGAGSSISGTVSGQFLVDVNGSNAQGQYTITGGTGAFGAVAGSGTFTEAFGPGNAPTVTFGGTLFNNTPATYNPYTYAPAPAVTTYYNAAPQYVPNIVQSTAPSVINIGVAPSTIQSVPSVAASSDPNNVVYNTSTAPATGICVPVTSSYAPDPSSSVTNPSFFYSAPAPCR